jgi:RNA polymerase-binding transcription factor DksA
MPGYTIFDGKMYPGVYHTVILPSFLVFHDRTAKMSKLVKKFQNIVYQEVKKSQKKFPYATYNKAHNRYEIFAPGRFEEGLNSFISPKDINKYLPPSSFNIKKFKSKNLSKITNTTRNTKKNNSVRDEARKKLVEWKKLALQNVEKEMKTFLNKNNLKSEISLAKKENRHFFTVAIVKARKEMIINIPQPYRDANSKNLYICEELCSQAITPGELMRLNAYKKLSLIFGKAYVSTIYTTVSKSTPKSYTVVIPVQ